MSFSFPSFHISHHGSTSISPHGQQMKSHEELTATVIKTKERAQDVQDAVEQKFTIHCRASRKPDSSYVNAILRSMKDQNLSILRLRDGRVSQTPPLQRVAVNPRRGRRRNFRRSRCMTPLIAEAIREVAETLVGSSISKMCRLPLKIPEEPRQSSGSITT